MQRSSSIYCFEVKTILTLIDLATIAAQNALKITLAFTSLQIQACKRFLGLDPGLVLGLRPDFILNFFKVIAVFYNLSCTCKLQL